MISEGLLTVCGRNASGYMHLKCGKGKCFDARYPFKLI